MKHVSMGEHETRAIGAPAGWDTEKDGVCGVLSVHDRANEHGKPEMVSAWELEEGDLAKLQAGAPIYLSVLGQVHPVVCVYVGEPPAHAETPAGATTGTNVSDEDMVGHLRQGLIAGADVERAASWAEDLVNQVTVQLNEASEPDHPRAVNAATSILARALTVNGLIKLTRDWWAEIAPQMPRPLLERVLRTFLDELPPGLTDGSIYVQEEEEAPHG